MTKVTTGKEGEESVSLFGDIMVQEIKEYGFVNIIPVTQEAYDYLSRIDLHGTKEPLSLKTDENGAVVVLQEGRSQETPWIDLNSGPNLLTININNPLD